MVESSNDIRLFTYLGMEDASVSLNLHVRVSRNARMMNNAGQLLVMATVVLVVVVVLL